MNIGIACDKEYLFLCKTMLRSLAENNRNTKNGIAIYYLNSDLKQNELIKFQTWCNSIGLRLIHIFVDETLLPTDVDFSTGLISSSAAFYRLLLPYLVPDDIDRILYLDCDMIVNGGIEELFEIDFQGKLLAVTPDAFCFGGVENINTRIGLPKDHKYFNSGMLMMNLKAIKNTYSLSDVFSCAKSIQDNMKYVDQDILNVLYQDKVKYVSMLKYNLQVVRHARNVDFTFLAKQDTRIIHFLAKRKPNNFLYSNKLKKLFWKYAKMNGYLGHYILFCIINSFTTGMMIFYDKIRKINCDLDYSRFEDQNN